MIWWLGSLPCAYWPMRPDTSAEVFSPCNSEGAINKSSNFFTRFSLPPYNFAKPSTSWGTKKLCCHAVPSIYCPSKPCSDNNGSNGSINFPLLSFALINPVLESNSTL